MGELVHPYKIEPSFSNVRTETEETGPLPTPSIDIVIVGSLNLTPEQNQAFFGEFIATMVADEVRTAGHNGKYLLLDAATGGTPEPVWKALARTDVRNKGNLLIMGHEEAWGPNPGSTTDFDFQRRETLQDLGITPVAIHHIDDTGTINGNFVQMYHVGVGGSADLPARGEDAFRPTEMEAALESARIYNGLVRKLLKRPDVESIGVYGIGTDGHIGEWQIQDMGARAAMGKRDAFVQPKEHYSIEAGMFPTRGKPNIYWQRRASEGEVVGRRAWQPEMSDQNVVVGMGLRDMLRLDHVVLAFNDEKKSAAFQMAMEGSVDGVLSGEKMEASVRRNSGEGESIWPEIADFAKRYFESDGTIPQGLVDEIENSTDSKGRPENLRCGKLFQAIYKGLEEDGIKGTDIYYQKMGEFAKRYIGKRSPVGQFIRMRALLGKKTTIVATPEVVRGTRYEYLAA